MCRPSCQAEKKSQLSRKSMKVDTSSTCARTPTPTLFVSILQRIVTPHFPLLGVSVQMPGVGVPPDRFSTIFI